MPKPTVHADDLMPFLESLDRVEQEANGYGILRSAVIEAVFRETKVTANHDGTYWNINIERHQVEDEGVEGEDYHLRPGHLGGG